MKSSKLIITGIFFYRCLKNTNECIVTMGASSTLNTQLAGGPTYN